MLTSPDLRDGTQYPGCYVSVSEQSARPLNGAHLARFDVDGDHLCSGVHGGAAGTGVLQRVIAVAVSNGAKLVGGLRGQGPGRPPYVTLMYRPDKWTTHANRVPSTSSVRGAALTRNHPVQICALLPEGNGPAHVALAVMGFTVLSASTCRRPSQRTSRRGHTSMQQ